MPTADRSRTCAIHPFGVTHISPALTLWESTAGIGLSFGDDEASLRRFLSRNAESCFVAVDKTPPSVGPPSAQTGHVRIVGTVLAGEDGRRGYLYHLAVSEDRRRGGVGRGLVESALAGLARRGIKRCHAIVFADNDAGLAFWRRIGFRLRDDLSIVSIDNAVDH